MKTDYLKDKSFSKFFKLLLYLIFSIGFTFAELNQIKNTSEDLFKPLMDNTGWVLDEEKNNLSISKKSLSNKELIAIKIEKEVSLSPAVIQEVILDVENYNQFLTNAESIQSKMIDFSEHWIDAYQYIPSNIPFLSDREYFFRISSEKVLKEDTLSIIHWYLLDQKKYNKVKELKKDIIYLNYGAGLWLANKTSSGKILLSYILYMDPGGSIPKFVIDKANKNSVITLFEDVLSEAKKRSPKKNSKK